MLSLPRAHFGRTDHRWALCLLVAAVGGGAVFGGLSATSSDPASTSPADSAARMVPLIFDTDVGNDVDDALALGMIHSLQDLGEARLLAVTISNDNIWSAVYVDIVNTFYGRPEIPIGMVRGGVPPVGLRFTEPISRLRDGGKPRYPHRLNGESSIPDATALLRRALAEYPRDGEIVLVVVGFSTNISRLLESGPDAVSPLNGRALVARKVKLLSIMAGAYGPKPSPEFNVVKDIPAAQNIYRRWPTPIVASGYEVGSAILYPGASILKDFTWIEHHPIREAYTLYQKMPYDRPCWDLTSVLYAVRPAANFFHLSPPGQITADDRGLTHFHFDSAGRHRYLTVDGVQIDRVRNALIELVIRRPTR